MSSAACLLALQPALASELTMQGTFMASAEYNDNPRGLLRSDARPMAGGALALALPLDYVTERSSFDLTARGRSARQHGTGAVDTEYFNADAAGTTRFERGSLSAGAGWHHDSIFNNPFEAVGATTTLRRTERVASAGASRDTSELSTVRLDGNWSEVRYPGGAAAGLFNYWYGQANASVQRRLGEQSVVSLTTGYGRYQIKDFDFLNETPSVQLQWKGALGAHWSVVAGAGASQLRTRLQLRGSSRKRSFTGTNFIASAQWQGERNRFAFNASRSLQPTGFGAMLTSEEAGVSASHDLSETLSVSVAAKYSRQFDELRSVRYGDHRYGRLELAAYWQYSELTIYSLQLVYLRQRYDPTVPIVYGTSAYLTVTRSLRSHRLI